MVKIISDQDELKLIEHILFKASLEKSFENIKQRPTVKSIYGHI